jgi:hypothetical protein
VPATTEKGLELGALEVTVTMGRTGWSHRALDDVFEDLRRKGIDLGRPMWLHLDYTARMATARQEAWTGE